MHTVYLLSPSGKEGSVFDAVWSSARDRDNTLYVATTRAEFAIVFCGPRPSYRRFADERDETEMEIEALPVKEAVSGPIEALPSIIPAPETTVKVSKPRKRNTRKLKTPTLFD